MHREHFINKIRELGYKFKRNAWRVSVWRHPETLHIIEPRQRDDLDDQWVRTVLRQAGCSDDEITIFMKCCKN